MTDMEFLLIRQLQTLPWRGNVRELRNTMERMVLLIPERKLEPTHLPEHLADHPQSDHSAFLSPSLTLAELESEWIRRSLARHGNHRTETARQLGISRRALHYKLERME